MNLWVTLGNGQTYIQLQLIFWVKMLINNYQVKDNTQAATHSRVGCSIGQPFVKKTPLLAKTFCHP